MAASSRQEQEHTGLQLPINSVKSLLLNPFERRTLGEKLCVKELGPEKPGLNLTQQTQEKGKTYQRSFSLNWYDRKVWLTVVLHMQYSASCVYFLKCRGQILRGL